jgi:hypothetical protein
MKTDTETLTGLALTYAVALAEGGTGLSFDTVATWWITINGKDRALSSGWAQAFTPLTGKDGDDIIDREKIDTDYDWGDKSWHAVIRLHDEYVEVWGTTRREAAMRCFVASRLGDEVEIPEALL